MPSASGDDIVRQTSAGGPHHILPPCRNEYAIHLDDAAFDAALFHCRD